MITYKFKEEDIENKREAIIEKQGHIVEFTLDSMEYNEKEYEKYQLECLANIRHFDAQLKNIEEFNQDILELSEEKRHAIWLYEDLKKKKAPFESKITELTKVLQESYSEKAEIKKQLGIEDEPVAINKEDLEETKENE